MHALCAGDARPEAEQPVSKLLPQQQQQMLSKQAIRSATAQQSVRAASHPGAASGQSQGQQGQNVKASAKASDKPKSFASQNPASDANDPEPQSFSPAEETIPVQQAGRASPSKVSMTAKQQNSDNAERAGHDTTQPPRLQQGSSAKIVPSADSVIHNNRAQRHEQAGAKLLSQAAVQSAAAKLVAVLPSDQRSMSQTEQTRDHNQSLAGPAERTHARHQSLGLSAPDGPNPQILSDGKGGHTAKQKALKPKPAAMAARHGDEEEAGADQPHKARHRFGTSEGIGWNGDGQLAPNRLKSETAYMSRWPPSDTLNTSPLEAAGPSNAMRESKLQTSSESNAANQGPGREPHRFPEASSQLAASPTMESDTAGQAEKALLSTQTGTSAAGVTWRGYRRDPHMHDHLNQQDWSSRRHHGIELAESESSADGAASSDEAGGKPAARSPRKSSPKEKDRQPLRELNEHPTSHRRVLRAQLLQKLALAMSMLCHPNQPSPYRSDASNHVHLQES